MRVSVGNSSSFTLNRRAPRSCGTRNTSADGLAARAAAFADPGATPIGDGLFALVVICFAPRLMGPYDDMAARRRKERETGRRVRTRDRAEEKAAVDA